MNYLNCVPLHYISFPFLFCSVKGTSVSNLSIAKLTSGPTLCSSRPSHQKVSATQLTHTVNYATPTVVQL